MTTRMTGVTLRRQENQGTHLVFRTEKGRLVLFGFVAVCIAILSIANSDKSSTFWYSATLYVLFWALFLVRLVSYRITVDRETLSYTTFRRATIAVNRADVLRVQVPRGRFRNVIKIERQEGGLILINAKPFGKDDLKIVLEFLSDKIESKPNWQRFCHPGAGRTNTISAEAVKQVPGATPATLIPNSIGSKKSCPMPQCGSPRCARDRLLDRPRIPWSRRRRRLRRRAPAAARSPARPRRRLRREFCVSRSCV